MVYCNDGEHNRLPALKTKETTLINLDNITVSLMGIRVLENTSWTIKKNQHWLVTGDNGSGKTTLLKAISGRLPICSGWMSTNFKKPLSKAVSIVSFDREKSIINREEAGDFGRYFSGSLSRGTSVYTFLSKLCNSNERLIEAGFSDFPMIQELQDQDLRSLSTGEMKNVMMAGALVSQPEMLILDEPFEGLDQERRKLFSHLLKSISGKGITIILSSHRFDSLPNLFTHRIHLKGLKVDKKESIGLPESVKTTVFPHGTEKSFKDCQQETAINDPKEQSSDDVLVKMENVTVEYGDKKALDNLSWELKKGENWVIKGDNGSGKSTLAGLIYADNPQAYSNRIHVFGKRRGSGESIWEIKQEIGFVSNQLQLGCQLDISVLKTVLSGFYDSKGLYRKPGQDQVDRAGDCLEELGLASWKNRNFKSLSTGEQRMVLIARALVKDPFILILDEICYGLDATNRAMILSLMDLIGKHEDRSLIYITHHEDEIPPCIDHCLDLPLNIIRCYP